MCAGPQGYQKMPWSFGFRWVVSHLVRVLGTELWSLEEHQILLTTEPSFLFLKLLIVVLVNQLIFPLPISFPSLLSSQLSWIAQASHGYQPAVAYQVPAGLSSSSLTYWGEMRQPSSRKESQEQAAESETVPPSSVRSPTRRPSHTTVTHVQRAQLSPMQFGCVFSHGVPWSFWLS